MAWTEPQDILDIYIGSDVLPPNTKLEKFIAIVERNILRAYPRIQERINDGEVDVEDIKTAVSFWIIQYLQTKGEIVSQESQAYTGAASRSVTYNTSKARYDLSLTAADLDFLAPLNADKAMSIDQTAGAIASDGKWVEEHWLNLFVPKATGN